MTRWEDFQRIKRGTHVVLLLRSNGVDKVVLGHVQLAMFVPPRVKQKIGAGLVRQLWHLGDADQRFLDGFLDTRHCVTKRDGKAER